MRLLIIGTNKFAYGPRQIIDRALRQDWQAECIEYQDLELQIQHKEIRLLSNSNHIGNVDILMLRSAGSSKHPHYDFSRLRQAVASLYLNNSKTVLINHKLFSKYYGVYDKLTQLTILHKAGLPVVDSTIYGGFNAKFDSQQLPLIFKPIVGSHGFGVKKVNSQQSFDRYQATLLPWKTIVQPYIDIKSDYRVLVIGKKVVGALNRKHAYKLGLESNGMQSEFTSVIGDTKLERLAIKATKTLGLEFAGVDIIEDKNGNRFILEVNDSPGHKRLDQVCKTSTANALIEYLT